MSLMPDMDLRLSEDQRLIARRGRLPGRCRGDAGHRAPRADVRRRRVRPRLVAGVADLGWCGVHLPEDHGRAWARASTNSRWLQEQIGRHLACVPFLDSAVLAGTALLIDVDRDEPPGRALAAGAGRGDAWLPFASSPAVTRAWRSQRRRAVAPGCSGAGCRWAGRSGAELLLLPAPRDGDGPCCWPCHAGAPACRCVN
jgi:alkylation response protein AidB-like acyl-CoA dehydrogenase